MKQLSFFLTIAWCARGFDEGLHSDFFLFTWLFLSITPVLLLCSKNILSYCSEQLFPVLLHILKILPPKKTFSWKVPPTTWCNPGACPGLFLPAAKPIICNKNKQKKIHSCKAYLHGWRSLVIFSLWEEVMQHSHSCGIAFLAVTGETTAFPVTVIREGQPGEESSPLFQFRGICWALLKWEGRNLDLDSSAIGFISNLTPNMLLILWVPKFTACFHPFSF